MVSIAAAKASPILVQFESMLITAALALLCVIPRATARSNAVGLSSFILSSFSRSLFRAPGDWIRTFLDAAQIYQGINRKFVNENERKSGA